MNTPALEPLLQRLAALPAPERDAVVAALPPAQARHLLRCLRAGAPGTWAGALRAAEPEDAPEPASPETQALAALDLSLLPPGAAATLLAGLGVADRDRLARHLGPDARAWAARLGAPERAPLGQALREALLAETGWPLTPTPAAPAAEPATRRWRPRWLSA